MADLEDYCDNFDRAATKHRANRKVRSILSNLAMFGTALVLGYFRLAGYKSVLYMGIAHGFVLLLLLFWWRYRQPRLLIAATLLTVLEVAAFLYFRNQG